MPPYPLVPTALSEYNQAVLREISPITAECIGIMIDLISFSSKKIKRSTVKECVVSIRFKVDHLLSGRN